MKPAAAILNSEQMKRFDCKRDDNNMFDFTLVDSHIHPFLTQEYNICNYPVPESPEEFVEILKRSGLLSQK